MSFILNHFDRKMIRTHEFNLRCVIFYLISGVKIALGQFSRDRAADT